MMMMKMIKNTELPGDIDSSLFFLQIERNIMKKNGLPPSRLSFLLVWSRIHSYYLSFTNEFPQLLSNKRISGRKIVQKSPDLMIGPSPCCPTAISLSNPHATAATSQFFPMAQKSTTATSVLLSSKRRVVTGATWGHPPRRTPLNDTF